MKTIIVLSMACFLLAGCVTTGVHTPMYSSGTESVSTERYTILEEKKVKARFNRIWILFFPFGGKNQEKREAKCLKRMMEEYGATGVLEQKYTHRKFVIPLLVITYGYREVELTGKPYVLKTGQGK